ncbi:SGNH/GDSL hydrolase family protein [Gordonia sp. PDNC005]|uniref:SGNH/GDSL hydrolase family protein n=1 Tax=unclassified Gordonia (in: high G+C Gram-positive bacteria) TaxID=2657482 RepID=UPI001965BB3C|nr:SGNH/GDSL hydrolase family protein [Gordonia sp. PDNC005]QRY62544.1 SGNH/GDSL hydrolase family protein [Gordonia sp. PDNC005]
MGYSRFVAIGDSQTEGMCDGDDSAGYRGWADRLAERLAVDNPDLRYANLAIRGKNTRNTRDEQLEPCLALSPDLVAAPLGMNDVIGRADPAVVRADLDFIYRRLAESGATVVISTFPDVARTIPFGRSVEDRLLLINDMMREFATTYGFVLVDLYSAPVLTDLRSWARDRLHASPAGHDRFAAGAAYALGLEGSSSDWGSPLPPLDDPNRVLRTLGDARWMVEFFTPWIIRKLRGRSLGDGRVAKRPELAPVTLRGV